MEKNKWVCSEPGVLAMTGTAFRIVYQPHGAGDFRLMQGDRSKGRYHTIAMAKQEAGFIQADLEEIGVS